MFLLFVYTTTVFCMYVFGCCLAQLFLRHNELQEEAASDTNVWGKTLQDVIPALVLLGYTSVMHYHYFHGF